MCYSIHMSKADIFKQDTEYLHTCWKYATERFYALVIPEGVRYPMFVVRGLHGDKYTWYPKSGKLNINNTSKMGPESLGVFPEFNDMIDFLVTYNTK